MRYNNSVFSTWFSTSSFVISVPNAFLATLANLSTSELVKSLASFILSIKKPAIVYTFS